MKETGNAHDADDCLVTCSHPDHAFDAPVDMDWLLRRLDLRSAEEYDRVVETARCQPVVL